MPRNNRMRRTEDSPLSNQQHHARDSSLSDDVVPIIRRTASVDPEGVLPRLHLGSANREGSGTGPADLPPPSSGRVRRGLENSTTTSSHNLNLRRTGNDTWASQASEMTQEEGDPSSLERRRDVEAADGPATGSLDHENGSSMVDPTNDDLSARTGDLYLNQISSSSPAGSRQTAATTSSSSSSSETSTSSPVLLGHRRDGKYHHRGGAASRLSTVVSFAVPLDDDNEQRGESGAISTSLPQSYNDHHHGAVPAETTSLHRNISLSNHTEPTSSASSSFHSSFHPEPRTMSSDLDATTGSHRQQQQQQQQQQGSDPFAIRRGRTLKWQNVSLHVKGYGKRPNRVILNKVWGEVPKKLTTAIMGSSGAGKSSLLNVLAGRMRSGGRIRVQASDVRLDNYRTDPADMTVRQMIAFVAQDDSLPPTETPREAIWFSAKLRLGRSMTDEQLDDLTDSMLKELGLTACADVCVGGLLLKGISGGERKRTSIGVELVVQPAMVFLDEPTSGLDAFSAVQVCQLLKRVANAGASVMFTIHQPSSKIFREFDHLILLNKGRVMYQGPVDGIPDYFAARGHPCPDNYNPSDWMMKVAQKNSVHDLERCGFFPKDSRELGKPSVPEAGCDVIGRPIQKQGPIHEQPPSFSTQVRMLVWREMKYIKRDRVATASRIVQSAFLGGLIGMIFFNVGQSSTATVTNLQSQFGAIVLILAMIMMGPAQAALLAFPEERPTFLREYTTRHYSVSAYFLSRLVMEALLGAIQCLVITTVSFYMIDFKGSLGIFLGAGYLLSMGSTAIAVGVGAAAGSSSQVATAFLPIILLPQMVFIGYFVVPELIPVWLRWLNYLCPMTYASRIMLLNEFYECSEDPFRNLGCELLLIAVKAEPDEVWWYWLILVAQFVVFRLIALAILHRSAKKFY